MIVIAILAVLATIATTSYTINRDKAQIAQAVTDIASISVNISHFYEDNRSYPASLAVIGLSGKLDPWKNPYRYLDVSSINVDKKLMGQVRKDKNLVPINSDYDLYSMGKDGKSQPPLTAKDSRDDIVRANDGRFVGLASNY